MGKSRSNLRAILVLVAAAIAAVLPRSASAEELGVGLDLDRVQAADTDPTWGTAIGFRIGPRLHVPLLVMGPEIGGSLTRFPAEGGVDLARGTAGIRLGVGEILRPGVFLHLGIGRLDGVESAQTAAHTRTAFTWDAGAFLDLTALPLVDVGVRAAWGTLAGRNGAPALGWAMLGLQVTLVL